MNKGGEEERMTTQQQAATTTWTIDKTHSNVDFQVKHLMISNVRGHFRDFDATLLIDEAQPANSSVSAAIDVASIDTNEPDRDAHLRSDDFFNAERFPRITFQSRRVDSEDGRRFTIEGDLTIRNITREVTLQGELEGRVQDPWGKERAAFTARTEISRREFGVRWNQALETGGVVVSDTVKISLYVEAVKQAPERPEV
jgi:polyisoprenoid-binding protein YceI